MKRFNALCVAVVLMGCGGAAQEVEAPSGGASTSNEPARGGEEGPARVAEPTRGSRLQVAGDAQPESAPVSEAMIVGRWVVDVDATIAVSLGPNRLSKDAEDRLAEQARQMTDGATFEFTAEGWAISVIAGKRSEGPFTTRPTPDNKLLLITKGKDGSEKTIKVDVRGGRLLVLMPRVTIVLVRS